MGETGLDDGNIVWARFPCLLRLNSMEMPMETQVSGQRAVWREFPIDPVATMALRLAHIRLALGDIISPDTMGPHEVTPALHQINALKRLALAADNIPLMVVLLAILDQIDDALRDTSIVYAHQAVVHLEDTLNRAC